MQSLAEGSTDKPAFERPPKSGPAADGFTSATDPSPFPVTLDPEDSLSDKLSARGIHLRPYIDYPTSTLTFSKDGPSSIRATWEADFPASDKRSFDERYKTAISHAQAIISSSHSDLTYVKEQEGGLKVGGRRAGCHLYEIGHRAHLSIYQRGMRYLPVVTDTSCLTDVISGEGVTIIRPTRVEAPITLAKAIVSWPVLTYTEPDGAAREE